ncbi:hypothetical protein ACLOJK_026487 [Asimina triloba]
MQDFNGISHGLDATWVSSIKQKLLQKPKMLKGSSGSRSCSIHSVPWCFRRSNPTAFHPQILSIGPFHLGKEILQAMEEHKWKYLQSIMLSGPAANEYCLELEVYLTAAKEWEESARRCYSETICLSSNEFVEMLVVDGFFIIQLLLKAAGLVPIDESDPIFKIPWIIPRLRSDLLLLENQIPFFVLQQLFDLMHVPNTSLACLAAQFLKPSLPDYNQSALEKLVVHDCGHLLHLLHSILLPETASARDKHIGEKKHTSPQMIFSASELREAGVEFKIGQASSFLGIKFHKRAIEIPALSIQDCTGTLLLNLIMFEQCYSGCTAPVVAAYASFMKCIVSSEKDAAILRRSRIIDSVVGGGDEEVAQLFKEISELASIAPAPTESYLQDAITAVDRYYRTDGRARRARMKNKYFRDPWPIVSCFLGA